MNTSNRRNDSPKGQAASPEPRLFSSQFALIVLVQLSFGLSMSTFLLLPKFLALYLGASAGQIGSVTALGIGFGVAGGFLVLFTIDRFGRRPLIVLGALLSAASCFGFHWVRAVDTYVYALRAAQGLSFSLVFNAAATHVSEIAPDKRMGQAIGLFGLAMLSTNAIAPAFAEPLSLSYGFQPVLVGAGTTSVLAALLALWVREQKRPERSGSGPLRVLSAALGIDTQGALFGAFAMGLGLGTLFTFVPPFALLSGFGSVSTFFAWYTVAALAIRLLFGTLADRVGHHLVAVLVIVGYSLVLCLTAALGAVGLGSIGVALGLVHGLSYPALNALAIERAAPGRRGGVMSLFGIAFNLGVASSAFGMGALADRASYPIVFFSAAALVALALGPLLRAFSRRRKDLASEQLEPQVPKPEPSYPTWG